MFESGEGKIVILIKNQKRVALGRSWIGALLFSLVVSVIFSELFASLVGLAFWVAFSLFFLVIVAFLGMIVHSGRGRDSEDERIRQLAAFKSLQAEDLKDEP